MADEDPSTLDGLERWAAEARAREAAEARVRERWLRTQAEEDARLTQVLAGLAERRAEAVLMTTAGRQVPGRVTAVGSDFVAVQAGGGRGRITLVPLHHLAWVRPSAGAAGQRRRPAVTLGPERPAGAEDDDLGLEANATLADVLAHAVGNRPRVALHASGATLAGELRAVGVDVVVVEASGEPPALTYVRLQSLSEISLFASG